MHRLLCLGGPDLQVAQIAPVLLTRPRTLSETKEHSLGWNTKFPIHESLPILICSGLIGVFGNPIIETGGNKRLRIVRPVFFVSVEIDEIDSDASVFGDKVFVKEDLIFFGSC